MRRMVCLDGLRGVLACYVMLSHALPFAPLPGWLHSLFQHGGAAVDVFFILSGLVIVQSLANFAYQPVPFLIARVARIYPVFLVVFTFAVVIQPLENSFAGMPWIGPDSLARLLWSGGWPADWSIGIATHLTMTHGLFPNGVLPYVWVSFLGAAWSLSTEWQFYLLALLVGERLGLVRLTWLFLAMSAVAIAWHSVTPEVWQFSRAFLPNKAQYFALGVASGMVLLGERKGMHFYLAALGVVLALCAAQGGMNKMLPPLLWTVCLAAQVSASSAWRQERHPWVPAFAGITVAGVAAVLQSRVLVWLGAVSYCIYLTNEPVQKVLGMVLATLVQGDAVWFTVLWIPLSVALPILASWWLHEWVEVPAQRYGRGKALATVTAG